MDNTANLQTWQEVFEKHPIPQVRTIQAQLQASISRDKERLRVLVGGNYRDLLSTAQEIIALNDRTRTAEDDISNVSQRCRPPQLDGRPGSVKASVQIAAHIRLLSRCVQCASLAIRNRELLRGAELTIVARQVVTWLSRLDQPPKIIKDIRQRATQLRRHLLSRVDAHLVHPKSSINTMVEALCAYSLVTSVSSTEAINRFRDLRIETLRKRCELEDTHVQHIHESFRYLMASIQSLSSLLTRGLNDMLGAVQRQPILEGASVKGLDTLGLDQLRALLSRDILDFTPYIKRVTLTRGEMNEIIEDWSNSANELFTGALSRVLIRTQSTHEIITLRKQFLTILLPRYFSTEAQATLLQSLQNSLNTCLLKLYQARITGLAEIGSDIAASSTKAPMPPSVWDSTFVQKPVNKHSASFVKQVQTRRSGTKGDAEKCMKRLKKWARSVRQIQEEIEGLKTTRWQDIIEDADEEEEDVAAKVVSRLSKEDPALFTERIETILRVAIAEFESHVHKSAADALQAEPLKIESVVFHLRALRDSSSVIQSVTPEMRTSHHEIISKLQMAMVQAVIDKIMLIWTSSEGSKSERSLPSEDLPSPKTFSVLREVCMTMSDIGGIDLWSSAAVQMLKSRLRENILESNHDMTSALTEFDRFYLDCAFSRSIAEPITSSDSPHKASAFAFWDRTRLLFGPLS